MLGKRLRNYYVEKCCYLPNLLDRSSPTKVFSKQLEENEYIHVNINCSVDNCYSNRNVYHAQTRSIIVCLLNTYSNTNLLPVLLYTLSFTYRYCRYTVSLLMCVRYRVQHLPSSRSSTVTRLPAVAQTPYSSVRPKARLQLVLFGRKMARTLSPTRKPGVSCTKYFFFAWNAI